MKKVFFEIENGEPVYAIFEVPYNGTDNNDYVNGQGFCCTDNGGSVSKSPGLLRAMQANDNPEKLQYYYHSDHLGSSSLITDLDGNVAQHIEYVPFGEVFIEERNSTWNTPYKFNAKELDEETGLYYYGARYYDPRISIWYGADPLQEKYPGISTYSYCKDNPIMCKDPDGRDVVYVNLGGVVVYKIPSTTIFQTYIEGSVDASKAPSVNATGWVPVPMPNIIQTRNQSGENVSGAEYQANDYLIAARTGYFNQAKNAGSLDLYTQGGNAVPQEAVKAIPDLDPTFVKAMTIQESHAGVTGISDVMQVNNAGDWGAAKAKYGVTKGETPNVSNSLYYGIRWLSSKGMKVTYNAETKQYDYTFKGWGSAAGTYNGGGTKGYQNYVEKMVNESKPPTPADY